MWTHISTFHALVFSNPAVYSAAVMSPQKHTSHLTYSLPGKAALAFCPLSWLTVLFSCQSPVPDSFAENEEVSSNICPSWHAFICTRSRVFLPRGQALGFSLAYWGWGCPPRKKWGKVALMHVLWCLIATSSHVLVCVWYYLGLRLRMKTVLLAVCWDTSAWLVLSIPCEWVTLHSSCFFSDKNITKKAKATPFSQF